MLKKVFFTLILITITTLNLTNFAGAEQHNGITIMLNYNKLDLQNAPFIEHDRILAPAREILEALDAKVTWNGDAQTVLVEKGNNTVTLKINSIRAYFNEELIKLDIPPRIVNDRTYLPLRFIAESVGANVSWSSDNNAVSISYDPQEIDGNSMQAPSGDSYIYFGRSVTSSSEEVFISGTITLPDGDLAPKGGIPVIMQTDTGSYEVFIFPEDQNSMEYVHKTKKNTSNKVDIQVLAPEERGYSRIYTYNIDTMNSDSYDLNNINFLVTKPNREISGKLYLPKGMVAPAGGLSFSIAVNLTWEYFDFESYAAVSVRIPEGENSAEYILKIKNPDHYKIKIMTNVAGSEMGLAYTQIDYFYNKNGLVSDVNLADEIDASENNVGGIDIVLPPNDYILNPT